MKLLQRTEELNNVGNYIGQENGHVTAAKVARVSWIVLVAYKNVA